MSDNFGFESPFNGENSIFNLLMPDEMSILKANSIHTLPENDYIFMEGDAPLHAIPQRGKVKMIKEG